MKKPIILLFAVLVLLLAGCDKEPERIETASGEVPQSSETGGASAPYVPLVSPEDSNQAFSWPSYAETAEGCYYGVDGLIYFCPRGGDAFYPLCSKPNCEHTDKNCNAFYGFAFGYCDSALYAFDPASEPGQLSLVKMNLDGTDHRVVAILDNSYLEQYSYECKFHHGKLYIQFVADDSLPIEEQQDHLVVVDLSDYSQTEPAADFLRGARLPHIEAYYKDKLYAHGTGDKSPNQRYEDYKLIEIDAVSGEARTLVSRPVSGLYATDSTLYYLESDISVYYEIEIENPGFRELDLQSGTVKDCGLPAADILWAQYDEDYIYAGSFRRNNGKDQTLYILSRDYKLVDQIELTNGVHFFGAASDRIYFYDSIHNTPISFYINKAQIGSHELQLIPIEIVR